MVPGRESLVPARVKAFLKLQARLALHEAVDDYSRTSRAALWAPDAAGHHLAMGVLFDTGKFEFLLAPDHGAT